MYDFANGMRGARRTIAQVAANADGLTQVRFTVGTPDIVAVQQDASGTESPQSSPYLLRDDTNTPSPSIQPWQSFAGGLSLAYQCGEATAFSGHQPGDTLELYSDYVWSQASLPYRVPRAFGTLDYVPAGTPGPFTLNEALIPAVVYCSKGFYGQGTTVRKYPASTLPPPNLSPPHCSPGQQGFRRRRRFQGLGLPQR